MQVFPIPVSVPVSVSISALPLTLFHLLLPTLSKARLSHVSCFKLLSFGILCYS